MWRTTPHSSSIHRQFINPVPSIARKTVVCCSATICSKERSRYGNTHSSEGACLLAKGHIFHDIDLHLVDQLRFQRFLNYLSTGTATGKATDTTKTINPGHRLQYLSKSVQVEYSPVVPPLYHTQQDGLSASLLS
jgi:hypothetical protein